MIGDVLGDAASATEFLKNFEQIMTQPVAAPVWAQCDLTTTGNFAADASALQSAMVTYGRQSYVQNQIVSVIQSDRTGNGHNALATIISDPVIYEDANLRSGTEAPAATPFENDLMKVLSLDGDHTALGGFFDSYSAGTTLLDTTTTPSQLLGIVYNVSPDSILSSFISNVGEAPVDTLIAAQPIVNSMSYQALAQSYVGSNAIVSIGQTLGDIADTIELAEHDIYGSSRLGAQRYDTGVYMNTANISTSITPVTTITNLKPWYSSAEGCLLDRSQTDPYSSVVDVTRDTIYRTIGKRYYELTDHLGNVLITFVDRKTGHLPSGATSYDYWNPDIATVTDYYPFGMQMPGRTLQAGDTSWYRFAYNGKLKMDEMYGKGNFLDYGARGLDVRLGRFIIVDPLTKKYPYYTPYQFAGNTPIVAADLDGKEPDIKFESAYSSNFIGGDGVDKKAYSQAFDKSSGSGAVVVGMATALGLGAVADVYAAYEAYENSAPAPSNVNNNPRTPSSQPKIQKTDANQVEAGTSNTEEPNVGVRRMNRLPDKGEPNSVQTNKPGTTMKKYGPDGNVQKEWNQGHPGEGVPENEQTDHIHDYKPNPKNPSGRGTRMPGRAPKQGEVQKDFKSQTDKGNAGNNN